MRCVYRRKPTLPNLQAQQCNNETENNLLCDDDNFFFFLDYYSWACLTIDNYDRLFKYTSVFVYVGFVYNEYSSALATDTSTLDKHPKSHTDTNNS